MSMFWRNAVLDEYVAHHNVNRARRAGAQRQVQGPSSTSARSVVPSRRATLRARSRRSSDSSIVVFIGVTHSVKLAGTVADSGRGDGPRVVSRPREARRLRLLRCDRCRACDIQVDAYATRAAATPPGAASTVSASAGTFGQTQQPGRLASHSAGVLRQQRHAGVDLQQRLVQHRGTADALMREQVAQRPQRQPAPALRAHQVVWRGALPVSAAPRSGRCGRAVLPRWRDARRSPRRRRGRPARPGESRRAPCARGRARSRSARG